MGRQVAGGLADIERGEMARQQGVLGDIVGASATGTGLQQADRAQAMQLAQARQARWEAEQANQRATEAARLQAALQAISIGGGAGGWF
jgi:hypothetical protein